MRFGKIAMFFILNGIIAIILFIHLGRWIFSSTTTASIIQPYEVTTIQVAYIVDGIRYTASHMRNDISLFEKDVTLRYLEHRPDVSRIDSFMGIYAEPLAWWLVFLIASSILFFTNNVVFSKGTIFQLHRKYPWISMEEYFPLPKPWHKNNRKSYSPKKTSEDDSKKLQE